jgi:hypothetical protein
VPHLSTLVHFSERLAYPRVPRPVGGAVDEQKFSGCLRRRCRDRASRSSVYVSVDCSSSLSLVLVLFVIGCWFCLRYTD